MKEKQISNSLKCSAYSFEPLNSDIPFNPNKVPITTAVDDTDKYFSLFFRENKT